MTLKLTNYIQSKTTISEPGGSVSLYLLIPTQSCDLKKFPSPPVIPEGVSRSNGFLHHLLLGINTSSLTNAPSYKAKLRFFASRVYIFLQTLTDSTIHPLLHPSSSDDPL